MTLKYAITSACLPTGQEVAGHKVENKPSSSQAWKRWALLQGTMVT